MVSVFGRRPDVEGPDGYVFFAADSSHPAYKLVKNVVHGQLYVSAFDLDDYPVAESDVLHTGVAAFEAALNTINVGKFNLGFCSIGMAEHCFYETINQAEDPRPVRQTRHRVRPGAADPVRGVCAPAGGQALRGARGRLRAQREPCGSAATCCSRRSTRCR